MRMIQETCEWVDVCPASSATSDDLIVLYGNVVLSIVESGVRLNDERKGKLALFQEGRSRRHSVKR
jgi:hypothetical protein